MRIIIGSLEDALPSRPAVLTIAYHAHLLLDFLLEVGPLAFVDLLLHVF